MTANRLVPACAMLGFIALASPAFAGCGQDSGHCWWRAHHAITHFGNRIAYLEANPDADDSYKGPIIDRLHRRIRHIRAAIGPRWPVWPSPCCYSRRPIYIR